MRLPSIVALLIASVIGSGVPSVVVAHPGGLNAEGCHTNRKTGDYHCHRSGASSRVSLSSDPGSRPFRNCAEARAAGAAPVHRGDPGYGPQLDRDNDGVGCEPYRGR